MPCSLIFIVSIPPWILPFQIPKVFNQLIESEHCCISNHETHNDKSDNQIPCDFHLLNLPVCEKYCNCQRNRQTNYKSIEIRSFTEIDNLLCHFGDNIELYVSENNPKTLNALISRLKAYYKDKPDVDPYKMAYGLMPSQAASCPDAKQQYINGHFCYADKFAILTNGLGIVRHIAFLDDDFKNVHPEMPVEKKSDSPDEDKSIGDSSSLKPVLSDFFALHPDFHPDTFLGDSAFDTIETYGFLKDEFHFSKALIPYNPRNESTLEKVGYNIYGYPTCPKDSSLTMKYAGHCHEKGRSDRDKWVCPKVHMVNGEWVCDCPQPCSTAKKGRTTYTYDNMDFRMFPGVQRDPDEWRVLYKIRTIAERAINHFKTNMRIAGCS
ncbi:MAG: hypothetical protein HDR27_05415, partial [Lachnospiraceae bacterium]|nr:hypothetical protein [Lachnospiraceae bacterium]